MSYEKTIFLKYLDGQAGLEEKRRLLGLLKENGEARDELKQVYREWSAGKSFDPWSSLDYVLNSRRRVFVRPVWVALAAAAIALFAIVMPLFLHRQNTSPVAKAELYTYPETETPMLLLSDGQVLQSESPEIHVSCTGTGIRIDGKDYVTSVSSQANCMLMVPYGHRAKVQFADGSVVRMNAHSRLFFPAAFGKERVVSMTGEALFDVSRDNGRPFIVELDDVRVQVLGTRFLVSGYENTPHQVALVSGSVNVSVGELQHQSVTLAPSQMYTLDDNGKINVEDIPDWGCMLDWADGIYKANGTSMKELLSYLGRYYGKNVECDALVADIACTGTLHLSPNLPDMLSELSKIFPIKSRMQNGTWLVSCSSK
ncbi:MAG: FecR domain-containing protein [Bacteroidales bacterium]|nr:FecR domain-containing protein [Bacteroidales bacterium]